MSKNFWWVVVSVGFLSLALLGARPASAAVPAGFEDRPVTNVSSPIAMDFTPDGRMLIATKPGVLRVYKDGSTGTTSALDISARICSNSERGMLGVAVDPEFSVNHYVYLYYTHKVGATCDGSRDDVNRVSRFTMNGDTVAPSSEKILINNMPSTNGNHNGGDIHFGKDGFLYASVGDGGCDYATPANCQNNNDSSRDTNILLGKILRVTRDGGIPATNPYQGTNSARCNVAGRTTAGKSCQETYAQGLRNPFRMAFDPDDANTSFRINDVGGGTWEEIDQGKAGADYGWNICEGLHDNLSRPGSQNCSAAPLTPPIHEYNHNTGCSSITGAAYVPDAAPWPSAYGQDYLFGDFVCGKIFRLTPKAGGGYSSTTFASGLGGGGPIAMTFGPSATGEALYYATFDGGGQIRRISYVQGNHAPNAVARVQGPTYGSAPFTANFDGSGSTDQDGDIATYEWDFDYTGGNFTVDATGATVSHTYNETSNKKAVALRVTDMKGNVDTSTVEVFPGDTAPPVPKIQSPVANTTFAVGQKMTLRGTATDADDGDIPASRMSWQVLRHHNGSHAHPYLSGTGTPTFTAPPPEDFSSTKPSGNYLEVRLTVSDSQGLTRTVTRMIYPRVVNLKFASRPAGLRLIVNGRKFRKSQVFTSWEGYVLTARAPRRQRYDGKTWIFKNWSDRRSATHVIKTPPQYTKYVARYKRR